METRELTDMTAVLRSINDGNPSNAERWVTLTQRVVRAETRANAAERAAASYLHWACPEYLAPQLGLAFECKSPAVNNEKFCERCAAAFLSAQMPNTGRVKKPWTHQ